MLSPRLHQNNEDSGFVCRELLEWLKPSTPHVEAFDPQSTTLHTAGHRAEEDDFCTASARQPLGDNRAVEVLQKLDYLPLGLQVGPIYIL